MKKGFTLIELMIVIIIIGVLATIGIVQYQAAVEKSRGAEARSVLGYLRGACAPIWMDKNGTNLCTSGALGLGTTGATVPSTCRSTNYFSYSVIVGTTDSGAINFTAVRCTASGKSPQGTGGGVNLTTNFAAGTDTYSGTGGF